eukprot:320652-Amphidinium_carterae.1
MVGVLAVEPVLCCGGDSCGVMCEMASFLRCCQIPRAVGPTSLIIKLVFKGSRLMVRPNISRLWKITGIASFTVLS